MKTEFPISLMNNEANQVDAKERRLEVSAEEGFVELQLVKDVFGEFG